MSLRLVAIVAIAAAVVAAVTAPDEASPVFADFYGGVANVPREELLEKDGRVIVNGGEFVTYTTQDGSFVVRGLPEGTHLLDIDLGNYLFPQVRLRVSRGRDNNARVRAIMNDGGEAAFTGGEASDAPVLVPAVSRQQWFVPREEYSLAGLVKNPMILMMLFTVGLMALMKLMPQEELKQQMKEMQQQVDQSKAALTSKKGN